MSQEIQDKLLSVRESEATLGNLVGSLNEDERKEYDMKKQAGIAAIAVVAIIALFAAAGAAVWHQEGEHIRQVVKL